MKNQKLWIHYALVVILLHVCSAIACGIVAQENPAVLSLCILAYLLGLRHAFDADHIALIDSTARKLVQQKQDAHGVGFYFSLGHCTVVFIAVMMAALFAQWAIHEGSWFVEVGSSLASLISGSFLLIIGFINLIFLIQMRKSAKAYRTGNYDETQFGLMLYQGGFKAKLLNPALKLIHRSWHMYPIGFVFALGFDTASEISLLVIAAQASQSGLSWLGILAFPLLFAAGMSMMDTADGILMTRTYAWALANPLSKLYFNMVITSVTVCAAIGIAIVTWSKLLREKLNPSSVWWTSLSQVEMTWLGYALVVFFIVAWALAYAIWKYRRVDRRSNAKLE